MLAAAAALLALVLTGCTGALHSGLPEQQPGGLPGSVTKSLDAAATDAQRLADASGGVVGVWAPWAGSYVKAFGTTTRGGSTPVTSGMIYRIGQNTIPMTCTVMLELVDRGVVELDDQLTRWVPGLVGSGGITLRELCQNTSGVGDIGAALRASFVNNPTRQWPPLELASDGLAMARSSQPGEKYAPSLTDYVLVGMALQSATNTSWPDLYKKYVFDRLGMASSSLPPSGQMALAASHPAGYAAALDAAGAPVCGHPVDVTRLSSSMGWTAGGVVSTVADEKAFVQALAGGRLLSDRAESAQVDGIATGASWQKYGLGVQLLGPLRGSSGAMPGYVSAAYADPSSGLTIVAMLNNSTPGTGFAQALAQRLAAIVSKVPATQKGAKVVASLPWSEQQATDAMTQSAPCPAKPAK